VRVYKRSQVSQVYEKPVRPDTYIIGEGLDDPLRT